ncbi:putative acyl-activating enzyme 18, peroxisomal [Vitis vinifera]|uniref:Putative acyl-activating enzyme 18, peroxisomal n=1 Tax=Vitis vinifera TaxID=29760 RepID=A0A438ELN7_VITVI|nr:putative acyl-activating enzyme 18, peroxisomal [Vitis vinifera]
MWVVGCDFVHLLVCCYLFAVEVLVVCVLVFVAIVLSWGCAVTVTGLEWWPYQPTLYESKHTNLGRLMETYGPRLLGLSYKDPITSHSLFQKFSVQNPEVYWSMVLKELSVLFHRAPRCILDTTDKSKHGGTWLPGAVLNIAECCLLPMTLKELREQVMLVANALDATFTKGDAIAIDMPMTVYAVIIYLAIVLAGFVVVSIADSFAAKEITTRLRVSKAKGIFTQDFIVRRGRKFPLYRPGRSFVFVTAAIMMAICVFPHSRVVEAAPHKVILLPAIGKMPTFSITNKITNLICFICYAVQDAGVTILGTVPSLVKTWKNTGCMEGLDWTKIKHRACFKLHPRKHVSTASFGAFSSTAMTTGFVILDENGVPYHLRKHGDIIKRTVGGYFVVQGRADDTMNLGGIKTSSVEIERVCDKADESILESAAISTAPLNGGPEMLVVFVVLKKGYNCEPDELKMKFSKAIQRNLNPLFKVSFVKIVPEFPRTASNKILRRVLRDQIKHELSVWSRI